MVRKKDLVVIGAVLALAVALYGVMLLARSGQTLSGYVDIYVDGALYASVPLGETRQVRVEQPNGAVNLVEVSEAGACMAYSSCKNQLCLAQGEVTATNWTRRSLGRSIICLPNRVVVELSANLPAPDDDPPDV